MKTLQPGMHITGSCLHCGRYDEIKNQYDLFINVNKWKSNINTFLIPIDDDHNYKVLLYSKLFVSNEK